MFNGLVGDIDILSCGLQILCSADGYVQSTSL